MLKKNLHKIKQATHSKLDDTLTLILFLLAGLALGLVIANFVVKDVDENTFCGCADYYMTDD